jgi:Glycosyl hydrolase family 26/Pectate lyase superfamily protein/Glycosyl hydrolases family 28
MPSLKSLIHLGLAGAVWTLASALPAHGRENRSAAPFNVKDYGATGDGITLDTAAISAAVQACARAGGGTVVFPAGKYVSGTFKLLSHVTLDLESGAVLLGSTNLSDYGLKSDYGIDERQIGQSGEGLKAGLIVANEAQNVGIVGHGTIDGRGTYFVNVHVPHIGEPPDFERRYTRQGENFLNLKKLKNTDGPVRPWMAWNDRPGVLITFANCTNVLIRDLTIRDSHNWTVNIGKCRNVEVSGMTVLNNLLIPNNDGLDISAENARVSDCYIRAGDDAIAANRCDNLTVANCTLVSRSSAIRFGDGRHCSFQNLVIRDSNRGIGIYGSADDVLFSDVIIQTRLFNGHWWGKSEPIYISARPNRASPDPSPIRNIRFSNIMADAESGILIYGTESSVIRDISFDRITLRLKGGTNSAAIGGNFDLRGLGGGLNLAVFKHDIPGMYCQYVNGLRVRGFVLNWDADLPDYFSDGIHCEQFKNVSIDGFIGRQARNSGSAIALIHGSHVSIRNCDASEGADTFLSLEDVGDPRLFVDNDLAKARRAIAPPQSGFTMSGNLLPAPSGTNSSSTNGASADPVETITAQPVPVTPGASPEARALLKFLYQMSGRSTLAGAHNQPNSISGNSESVFKWAGKYPALWGQDFGFAKEGDKDSVTVRQKIVDEARRQFYDKGSVVTLMWHEIIPTDDEPTTFREGVLTKRLTPELWDELLSPGSPLNRRWQAQVDVVAGYLKQLRDAKVPVIWRPYHEMNGDWFWWGQRLAKPGFKDLYQMMFDRFTKFHHLTNLLWTFDVNYGNQNKENYDLYYPGSDKVDLLAVDIYHNQFKREYYDQLLRLGGGKPIAIGECGRMPTPAILGQQPRYLWFMVWSGQQKETPQDAAMELFNSPRVLTLDQMKAPPYKTPLGLD